MRQKLPRLLLILYPREWRDRYGEELQHLVAELEDSGKPPASLLRNVLAAGLAERMRTKAIRATALVTAGVCAVAIALIALQTSNSRPPAAPGTELADRGGHGISVRALCSSHPGTKTVVIMNPNTGVIVERTRCNAHGRVPPEATVLTHTTYPNATPQHPHGMPSQAAASEAIQAVSPRPADATSSPGVIVLTQTTYPNATPEHPQDMPSEAADNRLRRPSAPRQSGS